MDNKKREMKREYKETPRPIGVYQILNTVNGKILVGQSVNLPGIFNREKCQLKDGTHINKLLQNDWNSFGAETFVFEVLEEINPSTSSDIKADLALLEEIWLDTLQPYGERGYNQRKKDTAERLQNIMRNRSSCRANDEREDL
jgi:hypothetical protein